MSSQSLPASCPLPSPRSVSGSPSCRRPPGPTAGHRHEPPLPRRGAGRSEGLQASLGPVHHRAPEPTGEATQRTTPAASSWGCFPCHLPGEEGSVHPPPPQASAGSSETPQRAVKARQRGPLGPPSLRGLWSQQFQGPRVPGVTMSLSHVPGGFEELAPLRGVKVEVLGRGSSHLLLAPGSGGPQQTSASDDPLMVPRPFCDPS